MFFATGWDWMQPVRDRNTGIWDIVEVQYVGSATLHHPHIVTSKLNSETPLQQAALLQTSVVVRNSSTGIIGEITSFYLGLDGTFQAWV